MSDHLVLRVDHLTTSDSYPSMQGTEAPVASGEGSSSQPVEPPGCVINVNEVGEHGVSEEEEPLIQMVECRICQEEDSVKNLEVPCACSGSLKVLILIISSIFTLQIGYQGTLLSLFKFCASQLKYSVLFHLNNILIP